MEDNIKKALKTNRLEATGRGGGGCINEGEIYHTDTGSVFVKRNSGSQAREMFEGEEAGLKAILATGTVKVPQPFSVVDNPIGGAALVMEYVDFGGLRKHSKLLGEQLARMHLFNADLLAKVESTGGRITGKDSHASDGDTLDPVTQFGFSVTTCCGSIPLNNSWEEDWCAFYARRRLQEQVNLVQQEYGNREIGELWSELQLKIGHFFSGLTIKPALLHGDLWTGNAGETADKPVIFDPASFYGHTEFEFGIATMFGGFGSEFYRSYHQLLPKSPGFDARLKLYQLFHYINHWNHFGSGYKGQSLSIMRNLVKMTK